VNAIQKPLSDLKNVLQNLTKHFKDFTNGFTELHAKLDVDMLLDFAIHGRQNGTQSLKSARKKQCLFRARCHVADWYNRLADV
jgi:hypothetical protein